MNWELLKELMDSSGYKRSYIAHQLGITLQGLNNKLQGRNEFKLSEIQQLRSLLHMDDATLSQVFFAS